MKLETLIMYWRSFRQADCRDSSAETFSNKINHLKGQHDHETPKKVKLRASPIRHFVVDLKHPLHKGGAWVL